MTRNEVANKLVAGVGKYSTCCCVVYDRVRSACDGNEILKALFQDMVDYTLRYAESVFVHLGTKMGVDALVTSEADQARTRLHDSTIGAINILARNMRKLGRDHEWSKGFAGNRAAYARFAMQIAFAHLREEEVV